VNKSSRGSLENRLSELSMIFIVDVSPVDYVGQEVVVPQSVVGGHSVVVHGEGPRPDASLVLGSRMSPELSGEDVEDSFPDPSTLREGREGEVVRVHFAET
jgi:hypothetical protein